MAKIDKSTLTKEQLQKAMACETPEELLALAKAEGIELTAEEADAYMAELTDYELDSKALKAVAGGGDLYCSSRAEGCSSENPSL